MWGDIKARLVADWKTITKFWSVRMGVIGMVLYPILISVQSMPDDIQAMFPLKFRVAAAGIFQLASLLTRVFVQPKLNTPPASGTDQ